LSLGTAGEKISTFEPFLNSFGRIYERKGDVRLPGKCKATWREREARNL